MLTPHPFPPSTSHLTPHASPWTTPWRPLASQVLATVDFTVFPYYVIYITSQVYSYSIVTKVKLDRTHGRAPRGGTRCEGAEGGNDSGPAPQPQHNHLNLPTTYMKRERGPKSPNSLADSAQKIRIEPLLGCKRLECVSTQRLKQRLPEFASLGLRHASGT